MDQMNTDLDLRTCYKWKLEADEYTLYPNGSMNSLIHSRVYDLGQYVYMNNSNAVWTCIPEVLLPLFPYGDIIAIACWILSQVCLLASIVIYLTFRLGSPDCLPVVFHMLSMLSFYLVSTIVQLYPRPSILECKILGLTIQISFMSQSTWLNVMVYDLWKQFRYLGSIRCGRSISRNFKYKALYAWGLPLTIFFGVNVLKYFNLPTTPGYDKARCLTAFYINSVQIYLFYFFYAVLVLISPVLIMLITIHICRFKTFIGNVGINSAIETQVYSVCLKLVIISGISWTVEIAEWIAFPYSKQIYWRAVTEIFSSLQGVALFFVYIMNSSLNQSVRERLSISS